MKKFKASLIYQARADKNMKTICFCFGYSEEDIRDDFLTHHRSTIMERIMAEKKGGRCQCGEKNPAGR